MFVTVQTRKDVAKDLSQKRPKLQDTKLLQAVLSDLGLHLEPLHPGAEDPELATHFYVSVPGEDVALEVSRRLQESDGVEAAYVKPPGAPPAM